MKFVIFLLLFWSAIASAQQTFGIKETMLYGGVKDRHVYDNGFIGSDSAVVQGGAVLRFNNGVYVDVFHISPFSTDNQNKWVKETDVTLGWRGDVGSVLRADVAVIYDSVLGPDVWEVAGEIMPQKAWMVGERTGITPFLQAKVANSSERNIHNKMSYFGGLYVNTPFGDKLNFQQTLKAGHHPEMPWATSIWTASYKAALKYQVMKDFTVGAEAERVQPLTSGNIQGREGENMFGLNVTYTIR